MIKLTPYKMDAWKILGLAHYLGQQYNYVSYDLDGFMFSETSRLSFDMKVIGTADEQAYVDAYTEPAVVTELRDFATRYDLQLNHLPEDNDDGLTFDFVAGPYRSPFTFFVFRDAITLATRRMEIPHNWPNSLLAGKVEERIDYYFHDWLVLLDHYHTATRYIELASGLLPPGLRTGGPFDAAALATQIEILTAATQLAPGSDATQLLADHFATTGV